MKRPFSILTLSDLHVDVDKKDRLAALNNLAADLHHWITIHKVDRLKWSPDYIAIPGDIIDCSTSDPEKSYKLATKTIRLILWQFNLKKNRVIVAPGNHDRIGPQENDQDAGTGVQKTPKETYKALKNNFLQFCINHNNAMVASKFCQYHQKYFNEFCKFNRRFVNKTDCCDWTSDDPLCYTSVLRVFPKLEVCFLSVNTEWLNTRTNIDPKQELHLAFPAVRPMIEKLNGLTHFTTITLMHRKPDSLSWKENNGEDEVIHSSLSHIKRCSDIIISGHDHNLRTGRPDVIENRVQHFKLGSPSCERDNEFKYSVSVIHVNPIIHTIKLLRGEYLVTTREWDFKEEDGTFPLRNKYIADAGLDIDNQPSCRIHSDTVCLQARYLGNVEIKQAIMDYFYKQGIPNGWELKPICTDTKYNHTISNSPTHIVLYSHGTTPMALGRLKVEYDRICNDPDNHKRRLLLQLIVSKVIVEVPQNNDKKDRC